MCIRKRLSTWLICVVTASAILAGCGSSGSSSAGTAPKEVTAKKEDTAGGSTGETAAEDVPEDGGAEAPAAEDGADSDSGDGAQASGDGAQDSGGGAQDASGGNGGGSSSGKSAGVTIEEQVLYDEDGIKITAKEYVTDSIWGDGIKVLLENDTENDIMISCDALIVNDYMIHDLFASDVAAGKKANSTIYLASSELKAAGIDNVGRIEIYFHASDSDSYENIFSGAYAEIETSAVDNMDTRANDDGMELYNEGDIRIVGKTVDENSFWGTAILLYIENHSGRNVGISVDDMSVNGFMMTPYFSTEVYDGKMSLDDITLMSSELKENGIETIEDVELKFHIYDLESYETITDSDIITFTAQ